MHHGYSGTLRAYSWLTQTWSENIGYVARFLKEEDGVNKLVFVGHSLGGALALSSRALYFDEEQVRQGLQIETVTFGAPLVYSSQSSFELLETRTLPKQSRVT